MRRTFSMLMLILLCFLMGCGGTSGVSAPPGVAEGRATFTIHWPRASRLIPVAAQSIVVALAQGAIPLAQQTLPRPAAGGTASVTFNSLPVGTLQVTATAYPNTAGTGTAQATATTSINIQANQTTAFSLTMASTIQQVTITPAPISLEAGMTTTLTATAQDAAGNVVLTAPNGFQWSSSNSAVATVDATTGKLTAVAIGTAQITAREPESGRQGMVSINVTAAGTLLTYDGFNYPIGSGIANQNGGFGWSNAWNEYGQGYTSSVIMAGSLTYGNLLTTGNALQTTSDNPIGHARQFAGTYGQSGTQLYLSILVRPLDFAGSDPYFGPVIGGTIFFGAGPNHLFALSHDGGGGAVFSQITAQTNQTYFLVVRITFKDGPDTVDLFVNPPLGQPLPNTPDVTKSDEDLGTVQGFNLGSGIHCVFDEFRVGTSYGAVAPTQ